jgi:hypothetical protein
MIEFAAACNQRGDAPERTGETFEFASRLVEMRLHSAEFHPRARCGEMRQQGTE